MSANTGAAAAAAQTHHRPHPQAPPRPHGVGRNRSDGGGGGGGRGPQHPPPQKGHQFRPGGGHGGGGPPQQPHPQAPPPHLRRGGSFGSGGGGGGGGGPGVRRGSGRRSPVPRPADPPPPQPHGGGGGGGGHGGERPPYHNVPWSSPPDANEALRQSHLLKVALERRGNVFDTEAGLRRRRAVMGKLEGMLGRWAEGLHPVGGPAAAADANDDEDRRDSGGGGDSGGDDGAASTGGGAPPRRRPLRPRVVLVSFGSYRLGVHRGDGDIDALALCPPHCTRADFFGSLVRTLKEDGRVTELHPVPGAYTPVLKFYLCGVPIDLLFARLADGEKLRVPPSPPLPGDWLAETAAAAAGAATAAGGGAAMGVGDGGPTTAAAAAAAAVPPSPGVPPWEEFQLDDADLVGLDEAGVRSLNGVRVAQTLLRLVPDLDTYRLTLRAVKEWALVRGLYSNVLGFLGGVNWAILVAWVCVRNEGAPAPVCLARFMRTFARWKWPKPVSLGPIARVPPVPGIHPLPVWNPRMDPRDAAQLVPIVTPCYPSMNSSYNVGQPQLRRMQQELFRGEQVVNGVAAGRNGWEDLFAGNDFFRQHAHYLQVNVMARNAEDFRSWFGLCESRLRILVAGLESPEYGVQCFPFAKFFHRKVRAAAAAAAAAESEGGGGGGGGRGGEEGKDAAADGERLDGGGGGGGGGADAPPGDSSSPRHHHRHVASFFVALRFAYGVENVDLRSCTEEFLYKVNAWEDRRWGMDLTIEHRTREHLPSFVFEEEEGGRRRAEQRARTMAEAARAAGPAPGPGPRRGADRPFRQAPARPKAAGVAAAAAGDRSGHAPSPPPNPSPHKRARRDSPE